MPWSCYWPAAWRILYNTQYFDMYRSYPTNNGGQHRTFEPDEELAAMTEEIIAAKNSGDEFEYCRLQYAFMLNRLKTGRVRRDSLAMCFRTMVALEQRAREALLQEL